jgi:hypothetical protein
MARVRAYNITIWVDTELDPEAVREAVEQIDLPGMQISVREVTHG